MSTHPPEGETPRWYHRSVQVKVWQVLAALAILPILVLWYNVVHQEDEILALDRNEVVTDAAGQRAWVGSFVNTNDHPLRDVVVSVDLLDSHNQPVGRARAEAAELTRGARILLREPLSADAARIRIHSVQWRRDGKGALMGPFREPWEFGYLMVDRASASEPR